MRDHPVIGEQILRQIPGMEEIAKAVRHEHERWDGVRLPGRARRASGSRSRAGSSSPATPTTRWSPTGPTAARSGTPPRSPSCAPTRAASSIPRWSTRCSARSATRRSSLGCAPGEIAERHQRDGARARSRPSSAPRTCSSSARSPATPSRTWPAPAAARAGPGTSRSAGEDSRLGPLAGDRAHVPASPSPTPVQIVGPYYARSARDRALPPRRDRRLRLVDRLASPAPASATSMALGERVARMVDQVPAAKRLADELEVLDAVRAVTTVNADGVEAALSEIAERGATALSCEFGAVVLNRRGRCRAGRLARAAAGSGRATRPRPARPCVGARGDAFGRPGQRAADPGHGRPDGRSAAGASAPTTGSPRCTRSRSPTSALLVTVHAQPSPRGFTNLCQRVARSVADGAELVDPPRARPGAALA